MDTGAVESQPEVTKSELPDDVTTQAAAGTHLQARHVGLAFASFLRHREMKNRAQGGNIQPVSGGQFSGGIDTDRFRTATTSRPLHSEKH